MTAGVVKVFGDECTCWRSGRHHRLCGSASRVNGDWLCQWERAIFDPTESTPVNRSPKNLSQVITSATPMAVPNYVHIRPRGFSGHMGEI